MRRLLFSICLIGSIAAHPQVSGKKKLIVTLGYGVALSHFRSDALSDASTGTSLDFAFDYGIARKWAMGLHYQRIGAHHIFNAEQSVRATTYELTLSYALIMRERSALDAMIGFGQGIASFTLKSDRLSSDAKSGSLSFGARYWKCITPCFGTYGSIWYTNVGNAPLTYADPSSAQLNGSSSTVEWRGVQITVGALVRF